MPALFRKYQPKSWGDLIGHPRLKASISRLVRKGEIGGHAYLLSGASGCGKSAAGRLIAQEICDLDNLIDLDASQVTPAGITELELSLRSLAIGNKPGRAVTINECHALRKDTITQLLVTLERIPRHVCWIFTTTTAGQQKLFTGIEAHPLLSRCVKFELDPIPHLGEFAVRCKQIAEIEELGGATLDEFIQLVGECKGNLRDCLSRIEAGEMYREPMATTPSPQMDVSAFLASLGV